jgi:predicted dehydrogenase
MKRLGMGVVGAGIMGRRMMAGVQGHARWQLASVWDPDAAALQAAAQAAPGATRAAGLEALAADPAVDLVYVASPPAFHRAGVAAALAARKPVLCEKPLAHTVAEAQALRDEVVAAGLPFAVHFPFGRSPAANRLIQLAHSGALGRIEHATVRARFARWPRDWQAGAAPWLAAAAQGGFTREVLSHFVFLALRLFGPATAERIAIDRVPGQAETRLLARLHHAGVVVDIDAAVAGDIVDDNGFELIGMRDRAALRRWAHLEHGGQTSERIDALPLTLDALAGLVEGRADTGLATVDEGLAVVQIIEALLAP